MDGTQEAEKKGWFSNNWKWALPCGCVTMITVCVVGVLALVFVLFSAIKSSDAYTQALTQAKAHPTVTASLGTPIEDAWYVMGNINVQNSSGNADLQIPISGPKGDGTIYVVASKTDGKWTISTLVFADAAGQRTDLLATETPTKRGK